MKSVIYGILLGLWIAWCVAWGFEMRREEGGAMPIAGLIFVPSLLGGLLIFGVTGVLIFWKKKDRSNE